MQEMRRNKVYLMEALMSDPSYILQHVQADSLITQREYHIINTMQQPCDKKVIEILDKIMNKGEDTCRRFLTLLKNPDIQETYPKLRDVISSDEPMQEQQENVTVSEYPMRSLPRGYCVIFNNEKFESPRLKPRNGSQSDVAELSSVFSWLGFQVNILIDQSAEQMRVKLQEYAQKARGDCFVCCVLSHGTQQGLFGRDGQLVSLQEVLWPFNGEACRALVGRPKVFFIQACQGYRMQGAVPVELEVCGDYVAGLDTDAEPTRGGTVPVDADFLVSMATVQECLSLRDRSSGSWFIQSLCRMLRQGCPRGEDVLTILTKVNKEVSKMEGRINFTLAKQMPEPKYTLTQRLVFQVPS